jgi:hemerythrin-like domain-containing protein
MNNSPNTDASDAPLNNFSHCHEGIVNHLKSMSELPDLLLAAERARTVADDIRNFFKDVIYNHHEEEERVLFEAVLASANEGEELARVKAITDQLTREHRKVESMYTGLDSELKKMAKGQPCQIDTHAVEALVREYGAHAAFEEAEFLPLSETILSRNRNHMAALGLSLHVRHVSLSPSPT